MVYSYTPVIRSLSHIVSFYFLRISELLSWKSSSLCFECFVPIRWLSQPIASLLWNDVSCFDPRTSRESGSDYLPENDNVFESCTGAKIDADQLCSVYHFVTTILNLWHNAKLLGSVIRYGRTISASCLRFPVGYLVGERISPYWLLFHERICPDRWVCEYWRGYTSGMVKHSRWRYHGTDGSIQCL